MLLLIVAALSVTLWQTNSAAVTLPGMDSLPATAVPELAADADVAPPDSSSEARVEQGPSGTTICVVEDSTGRACPATVLFLGRWGKYLDRCKTDDRGQLLIPESDHQPYGVVAFSPRHQIRGAVLRGGEVTLRLATLTYVRVTVMAEQREVREILAACDRILDYTLARHYNPILAGPDFLEHKAFHVLGLHEHRVPMADLMVDLPRYIEVPGTLRFQAKHLAQRRYCKWPDARGALAARDAKPKAVVLLSSTKQLAMGLTDTVLRPRISKHVLVARYHPTGTRSVYTMLSLRLPSGSSLPLRCMFSQNSSGMTFRIHDLRKGTFIPTLVFVEGDTPWALECEPVKVDGHTEVVLRPRVTVELTIEVRGDQRASKEPSPTREVMVRDQFRTPFRSLRLNRVKTVSCDPTTTEVILFDKNMRRLHYQPVIDGTGKQYRFARLPPAEYRVLVRAPNRVGKLRTLDLREPAERRATVDLLPVCRLDFTWAIENRARAWLELLVRDLATGEVLRLGRQNTETLRTGRDKVSQRLSGRGHLLDLPYGTYAIELVRRGANWRTTVVLDSPVKTIEVE